MSGASATAISPDALRGAVRSLLGHTHGDPAASVSSTLEEYVVALARFGAHTDLVGARTAATLAEIALLDALVVARHAEWLDAPCWEVGAGGASLLVPLAVLHDAVTGVVVEPRQKRAAFLRMALGTLGLGARIRVAQQRVEVANVPRGVAGSALSRAVFAPSAWIAVASQLVRPGGNFVVHDTDVPAVAATLRTRAIERYDVPSTHAPRVAIWLTTDA